MTDFRFDTVTVLGAGTMGRGIAQVSAATGSKVFLLDTELARANASRDGMAGSLERAVAKGRVSAEDRDATLERVVATDDFDAAVSTSDVIVEAVPESMDLKRTIFGKLAKTAPGHALLGSNTSSLSITEIAEGTGADDRIVGLHFFNPVPVMKLIEVVHGDNTSDAAKAAARDFALRLGKDPIAVRDAPGFATSRLGVLLGLEAMRMLEQEVASAGDIDKAMELGYRHPMGPLKLTDLVGLDVRLAIAEHLQKELGTDTFAPPQILRDMVAAGKLGKKSGAGFYEYGE
ncbi:MAG: putative 3-hydroxyacyl-CoA dehydrogenase [Planctomycetota bacterium]|nr:MAG: putative 3-hydroxyacyl-CoA dehydrogenase [Planctomycetota bacterium]